VPFEPRAVRFVKVFTNFGRPAPRTFIPKSRITEPLAAFHFHRANRALYARHRNPLLCPRAFAKAMRRTSVCSEEVPVSLFDLRIFSFEIDSFSRPCPNGGKKQVFSAEEYVFSFSQYPSRWGEYVDLRKECRQTRARLAVPHLCKAS